jgi:hypothetical protein
VWDVLFQIGASILLGAAVGYGVAAIIDALSQAFARLWEGLVGAVREIWGYINEATQHLLAVIAQWMDQTWAEIEDYLRQEFGYRREWWVAIFMEAREVFVGFVDPLSSQGESTVISLGVLEPGKDVQLPTSQNPIAHKLVLQ